MATALSPRTKRTLRTIIQIIIGLAAAVPDVLAKLPLGASAGQVLVVTGLVTHYFGMLESLPFFPEWLKLDEPAATVTSVPDAPAPDPAP